MERRAPDPLARLCPASLGCQPELEDQRTQPIASARLVLDHQLLLDQALEDAMDRRPGQAGAAAQIQQPGPFSAVASQRPQQLRRPRDCLRP